MHTEKAELVFSMIFSHGGAWLVLILLRTAQDTTVEEKLSSVLLHAKTDGYWQVLISTVNPT